MVLTELVVRAGCTFRYVRMASSMWGASITLVSSAPSGSSQDGVFPYMMASLLSVAIQVLQASVIHKHPATLNTRGLHLYQFAVGGSITPFAFSRARCGDSLSR